MASFLVEKFSDNQLVFGGMFLKAQCQDEALGCAYRSLEEKYSRDDYFNYDVIIQEITQEVWDKTDE